MSKIRVYARARPCRVPSERLRLHQDSVKISLGQKDKAKYSGGHYKNYEFSFDGVLDENASQEQVFEVVATHIVDKFLDGYNGTIFAYGQTASGKTYTMEGSARRYSERGLVSRILSQVYSSLEERKDEEFTVHVSFMEIYQDIGYDLLNPGNNNSIFLITLPKVYVSETVNGEVIVRNLSTHLASTEKLALNFFLQGCTCRKVAETAMNAHSSRSHVVFSIVLSSQKPGSEILTRSKLHLVDLAGSERVAKTGADGRVLEEAKVINLTLHHLEHVIVKLQRQSLREENSSQLVHSNSTSMMAAPSHDKTDYISGRDRITDTRNRSRTAVRASSTFIPYRNSVLTMLLRDSLGGNCFTAMIATISAEEQNIYETLSTCQFAQRVACISNKAKRNEELDDKVVIHRLKQRVAELEQKLISLEQISPKRFTSPEASTLSEADRKVCHQVLFRFLHREMDNPLLEGIDDSGKVLECFLVLRDATLHALSNKHPSDLLMSKPRLCWEEDASCDATPQQNKERKEDTQEQSSSHHHPSPGTSSPFLKPSLSEPLHAPSPFSMVSSSGFISLVDEEALDTATPSPSSSHSATTDQDYRWSRPRRKHLQHSEGKSHSTAKTQEKLMSHQLTNEPINKSQSITLAARMQETPKFAATPPQLLQTNLLPTQPALHRQSHGARELPKEESNILELELEEKKLWKESQELHQELAVQHDKVLSWKSKRNSGEIERLVSERMVEQQIKLKLAKVTRNLLDVQYQIKRYKISQDSEKCKQQFTPLPTFQTRSEAVKPAAGHQAQRTTHEDSSKSEGKLKAEVNEKAESSLIVEVDKHLELKEAATRKRLLALKQLMKKETSSVSLQPGGAKQVLKQATDYSTYGKELKLSSGESKKRQTTSSPQSQESNEHYVMTAVTADHRSRVFSEAHTPEHPVMMAWKMHVPTGVISEVESATLASPASYRQWPPTVNGDKPSKKESSLDPFSSRADGDSCDDVRKKRIKLAIADDQREINYMNTIQSQRSRVLRIRRCIAAATLIQREWRKYKQRNS